LVGIFTFKENNIYWQNFRKTSNSMGDMCQPSWQPQLFFLLRKFPSPQMEGCNLFTGNHTTLPCTAFSWCNKHPPLSLMALWNPSPITKIKTSRDDKYKVELKYKKLRLFRHNNHEICLPSNLKMVTPYFIILLWAHNWHLCLFEHPVRDKNWC